VPAMRNVMRSSCGCVLLIVLTFTAACSVRAAAHTSAADGGISQSATGVRHSLCSRLGYIQPPS
jgi:hypothetical protein